MVSSDAYKRPGWFGNGIEQEAFTAVCSWHLTAEECAMNAFVEHHQNSIQFGYRCSDRLLLNGLIQPFQQPEQVLGFFNTYRDGKRVTGRILTDIADQFQNWLKNRSEKWGAPVLDASEDERRDDFVLPYLKNCEPDRVAVILKAREPARILVAIGGEKNDSPHLEFKQRWVNQFKSIGAACSSACAPTSPSRPASELVTISIFFVQCIPPLDRRFTRSKPQAESNKVDLVKCQGSPPSSISYPQSL
jgi:hypothetical protein